ncbi:hypothetical protein CAPTEDRAFT_220752 [Capitella teleta]|uniref:RING-type domain-containing protein n=1 Tax=Capitella teleta TaxID=283909 RepID=R7U6U4_CAPTE|nr:hypothetical protein CAPTEDRAFT_220752 [Capitella teleta]|eukprot:ELU01866.1 hypothetical protein CAPTEDRAFT_220752 [Capitella teleta]
MASSAVFAHLPSGNYITSTSGNKTQHSNSNPNDFQDEKGRLKSFAQWPYWSPVKSEDFSNTGLYFTGRADIVKCSECSVEIGGWGLGQTPSEVHRERNPSCPFVKKGKSKRRRGKRGKKKIPTEEKKLSAGDKSAAAVVNAIRMVGYPDDLIQRAIEMQGQNTPTIESTFNAIHRLEDAHIEIKEIIPKSDKAEAIRRENRELRLSNTCRLCRAADVQVVTQPCNHFVMCSDCLKKVAKCPKCKATIVNSIRVYRS